MPAAPELLTIQLALLALHQERAGATVALWFARDTAGGDKVAQSLAAEVRGAQPELLVSVAICLAASLSQPRHVPPAPPIEAPAGELVNWMVASTATRWFRERMFHLLGKRRLPYNTDDLDLLAGLVALAPDFAALKLVVAAAREVSRLAPGPAVARALDDLLGRLRLLKLDQNNVYGALLAIAAESAGPREAAPSALDDRDAFGAPARQLIADVSRRWPVVIGLIAHLASARGTRPSSPWYHRLRTYADNPEFSEVVAGMLRLVTIVELTDEGLPRESVLSVSNSFVVRGAVWATPYAKGDWRAELLAQVALRCGAWKSTVSATLCSSVALAAIDALSALEDELAIKELEQLFGEVASATMVKKIGAVLQVTDAELTAQIALLRSRRRTEIHRPWLGRWG